MIDRAETAHPDPLDVALGRNIRTRRKSLGITQAGLGDAVGLTFQQIQKYERGTNRVSFSKLVEISKALNCRVGSLIDGLEPGDAPADFSEESGQALATTGALELLGGGGFGPREPDLRRVRPLPGRVRSRIHRPSRKQVASQTGSRRTSDSAG